MEPVIFIGDLHFPPLAGVLGAWGRRGFGGNRNLQPNCHKHPTNEIRACNIPIGRNVGPDQKLGRADQIAWHDGGCI